MIYGTAFPIPPALAGVPGTNRIADAPARPALASRAITVALHLRAWSGQRLDRRVTEEVLEERQAQRDAGRFETRLVPPAALAAVHRAHGRARAVHNALTLPWGDESVRILAATAYFEYREAMEGARIACERAHDDFCAAYPGLVASAPARLAALFRASDFPSAAAIRERFGVRLVVMPVPDGSDFRVALGADAEAAIRAEIERDIGTRYADAQRDLWTRLLDAVRHFAATMRQEGKVFHASTLTKLVELARLAPRLSLVPDARLEALSGEVLEILDGIGPADLRGSPALRRRAAARAQTALTRIEEAMAGAF